MRSVILTIGMFLALGSAPAVLAVEGPLDNTGQFLNEAAGSGGYGTTESGQTPLINLIAAIIQGVLSMLGIFFFLYIIYAGWLWVTSNGDQDRITKAKSILKNNIIGIIVVLAAGTLVAYAITAIGQTQ